MAADVMHKSGWIQDIKGLNKKRIKRSQRTNNEKPSAPQHPHTHTQEKRQATSYDAVTMCQEVTQPVKRIRLHLCLTWLHCCVHAL